MYEVISYNDKRKWDRELAGFSVRDIFYLQSYCNLYQELGDGEPFLFIYKDYKGNKVCYAFFKRKLNTLPFLEGCSDKEMYDIITPPYGYGGPFYVLGDSDLIYNFRRAFEEFCQSEHIICEFIRFHPLYQNHVYMLDTMDIFFDRETVYVDLDIHEDDIFKQYHKNHKRNLDKARKNQLEFKVFSEGEAIQQIDNFNYLYKETMDKLNASKYSYFSTEYFKRLFTTLAENTIMAATFYDGEMVSAAICLFEGDYIHYHLGCSQKEKLHLGVNVFLLHHVAIWGKQNGYRSFHLGGGHVGRDSLFQFKSRFNPTGVLDFYCGKRIHSMDEYLLLVNAWEKYYFQKENKNFFPSYRAKPIEITIEANRSE